MLAAMPENLTTTDLVLNALVLVVMLQMAWFSVMLARRGVNPIHLRSGVPPLLAVWVLMWPVYSEPDWLWLGLAGVATPPLLAATLHIPFWEQLRLVWATPAPATYVGSKPLELPPFTHFILAIFIAGLWFQNIPEFGFGLALCQCLAFPLAQQIDHFGSERLGRLGFPAHPEQTLAGHLGFVVACTILLTWALHVYHSTGWQSLFIATLLAAMVGSAARALIPDQWNKPAAMLAMGTVMWLL